MTRREFLGTVGRPAALGAVAAALPAEDEAEIVELYRRNAGVTP